ncbi:GNAT family N-acetyltransferase [Fluviicola taffensis]|uniref:GCN5-related N-acetyltransferase n=1 Tax=Fluviicola taffensis (strain DSM 16823 / NCIMB 13979 / RW262) TaxID=755732 RepID=F2IA47_FLUTR|nr:GNAT family protein [Fluviicola taffensis]AEA45224.1 GCN5-related N-acetyltransferase [Fluviicola taffensis DSM 16823]
MNFKLIETDRLLLKGLSTEDMTAIFERNLKPKIKILLGHRSDEDYEKEYHKYKNGYASYNRSFMLFLLVDKASDKIIGRCGLHNWNVDHRRAEIGYGMEDETYKKQGLMSEAVEAIIAYGFEQMNLNRIEALVAPQNAASLKLLEKNNFVWEGVLRNHYYISGTFEDSVMFSKLQEEYLKEKK